MSSVRRFAANEFFTEGRDVRWAALGLNMPLLLALAIASTLTKRPWLE